MRGLIYLSLSAAWHGAMLALPATAQQLTTDSGSWNLNVTSSSAASGYRYGDVYAEYSSTPGQISHFSWLYSPAERSTTTTTDNPAFNSSIVDGQGDHTIEVRQIVELNGTNVALVGTGLVTMKCGLGGSGRGCAGSTVVNATPEQ